MSIALTQHIEHHSDKALNTPLELPFLIDLTKNLGLQVHTQRDAIKEKAFRQRYEAIHQDIDKIIDQAVSRVVVQNPAWISKTSELKKFIKNNIISVTRINVGDKRGIKVLPDASKEVTNHFMSFLKLTGLYIGAVHLRREELDGLEYLGNVRYGALFNGKTELKSYYPTIKDFASSRFLSRFSALCNQADALAHNSSVDFTDKEIAALGTNRVSLMQNAAFLSNKPHFLILSKATIDLLQGLFKEISTEKWEAIHKEPALAQVFQSSLMMIREHLAAAESFAISNQFAQFAQSIELIHAEMATLLELLQPFKQNAFAEIYEEEMRPIIPSELQKNYKGGLGKTAMNIFAGINAAIMSQKAQPVRIFDENAYFEEVEIVGQSHKFATFQKGDSIQKVDLYVAQFNPNINIDPGDIYYHKSETSKNIKYLLTNNRAAPHLTVAIDTTIERSRSANIQELLTEFQEEIKTGKLNVVIFLVGKSLTCLAWIIILEILFLLLIMAIHNGKHLMISSIIPSIRQMH